MPVATSSIDALHGAVMAWQPDAIVSVTSPGLTPPAIPGLPRLDLSFPDTEAGGVPGCTAEHVRAFVHFHAAHRGRSLLIHCTAGLSRSPALAILACMLDGMTAGDACLAVCRAVPEASPNRRVLYQAELALNLGTGHILDRANRTFLYRHGAHGAAGVRTGLRVVRTEPGSMAGRPPSRVLPGRADPGGHLGAEGGQAHRISGGTHPAYPTPSKRDSGAH